MSQAEDLLNTLSETVTEHEHPVIDSDSYFVIDPDTRVIENATQATSYIMQYDHDSERFTFELPRYVDGHDMLLCNVVKVHYNNIDGETGDENADVADIYDLRRHPDDSSRVICSWSISRQATQLAGILSFLVQYMCKAKDGTVTYEWHTDIYSDVEVKAGRNNGEGSVIQYSDILEQWRTKLFGAGDSVIADIAAATEEQKAAIELKAQETLATIPEDYTATYNMAEEALRRKADAIELDVEGTNIRVDNASDGYLLGMEVYGRTEQTYTTGKNLLKIPDSISTIKGVSFVVNRDRSVSVAGTPTEVCAASIYGTYGEPISFPAGEYIVSGGVDANRYIRVRIHSSDGTLKTMKYADGTEKTFTVDEGDLISVSIYFATLTSVSGLTFYPMIRLATDTDGTYEPYSKGHPSPSMKYSQELIHTENPGMHVYGKNLATTINSGTASQSGITITYDKGSSEVIFDGTSTIQTPYGGVFRTTLAPGIYTASIYGLNVHNTVHDRAYVYNNPAKKVLINYIQSDAPKTFEVKSYCDLQVDIVLQENSVYDERVIKFQIEKGEVATEYEPYRGNQTATFNHILRGIKVKSGGNYTDSTGQQWIADYVDCENKRIVRRIGLVTLDGTRTYRINTFRLKSGLYVYGTYFKTTDEYESPVLADKLQYQLWDYLAAGEGKGDKVYNVTDAIYVYLEDQSICTVENFTKHVAENPITVQYILGSPTYESLTDEEVAAYKALHSNYYTTTIQNDSEAHMKVAYAADTEIYLRDNQPVPTEEQVTENIYNYLNENGAQYPSDEHINDLIRTALEGYLNGTF